MCIFRGEIPRSEVIGETVRNSYIQKPVVGGKVTILAVGTRKLPLATIPLCKDSGTKEEEMWSNPFGGLKKKSVL